MIELADGTHTIDRETYDQVDRVNFSTLKFFDKSPAHYRANLAAVAARRELEKLGTIDDDDTDSRQEGRVVSIAVFEPEIFNDRVVTFTGKTRYGESWDRFKAKHAGKECVTPKILRRSLRVAEAVRSSPQAGPMLTGGRGEVTVAWTHVREQLGQVPGYSMRLKGRLDYVNDRFIFDLKRTKNASPAGFGREVVTYASHVQAGMYRAGVKAATGLELGYRLIAVEPVEPYAVQVYDVPERVLELGARTYQGWLDRLDVCLSTNEWPAYADGPLELELPHWALPNEDDDVF